MAKRRLSRQQVRRIRSRQKQSHEEAEEFRGLIIAQFGRQVEVEPLEPRPGQLHPEQPFRSHVRANVETLVTGDRVRWQNQASGKHVVTALEARRSLLCRPDKFKRLKPVAANVDQMGIVIAPEPMAHANLIDRYLVAAHLSELEPILILNKADLIGRDGREFELLQRYEALGYPCLHTSAESKEQSGLDALKTLLNERTSILVGQSGVGKSSLIQRILPETTIRVGDLSEARQKGTHTTTTARLYHLPTGGDLIDSPGIREFGLWHIQPDQLIRGFTEFLPFSADCRFRNCDHFRDPGCGLQAAFDAGELQVERVESFQHIRESLDEFEVVTGPDTRP